MAMKEESRKRRSQSESAQNPVETSTSSDNSNDTAYRHPDETINACLRLGMKYFPSYSSVPDNLNKKVRLSMFPPTAEEIEWMHLGNNLLFTKLIGNELTRLIVLIIPFREMPSMRT